MQPLDIIAITCASTIMLISIVVFINLLRLPYSRYAILLQLACFSILPLIILEIVANYVDNLSSSQTFKFIAQNMSLVNVTLAVLCELEFLKLLIPYFSQLSQTVILQAQIAIVFVSIAITLITLTLTNEMTSLHIRSTWILISACYDLIQQCFMLYFIFSRLKKSTQAVQLMLTLIVASNVLVLGLGLVGVVSMLPVTSGDPNVWAFHLLLDICVPTFELLVFTSIIVLRNALTSASPSSELNPPPVHHHPKPDRNSFASKDTLELQGEAGNADANRIKLFSREIPSDIMLAVIDSIQNSSASTVLDTRS
eukprot:jgi/Hompol1/6256/HPOL_002198-RA